MSQVAELKSPPVPPPLPSCPTFRESKSNPKALNSCNFSKVDENELDLAVKRFQTLNKKLRTFYTTNTNLVPQLQDGPKCGLVALSIATSKSENFVKVEDIFQTAVSLGFTKQGEMFCANSLTLLAEKYGFKTRLIREGLNNHLHCILMSLLKKNLLLVPYDADFNHAPCCKKGFKAHWAVITGFVIFSQEMVDSDADDDDDDDLVLGKKCSALCECINDTSLTDLTLAATIHQERILIRKRPFKETHCNIKEGKLYLIGMQGKSRHLALWSFDEMAESNSNLISFSNAQDPVCYVFPKGGIEEGLKGKAIILECTCLP